MKTTLEIPDALFRRSKAAAAERGIPLREFVSEALAEKFKARPSDEKPWLKSFGALRSLHAENLRIDRLLEEEFGQPEAEDLA